MNKSDKYYMKHGKLELSMLDSDDDEEFSLQNSEENNIKKDMFFDMEFPHSKKIREKKETKVKMSKDIYSTLQNMGQFLVKSEEADIARAQKLAQIGLTLKVEDMELPPKDLNKDIQDIKQKNISSDIGVLPTAQTINHTTNTQPKCEYVEDNDILERTIGPAEKDPQEIINTIRKQNKIQENKNLSSDLNNNVSVTKANVTNIDNVSRDDIYVPEDDDAELKQNQIDKILTLHFGRIRGNYPDAKILKAYIDEQISRIENYGS